MKYKRILIAIGGLGGGGAERVASLWAGQLADLGYDVSCFVFARKDDEYSISKKVKLYSCANSIEEYLTKSHFVRFKEIRRIIKTIQPDYIIPFLFINEMWMMVSSVGLRIKRVETVRSNPWMFKKHYSLGKRVLLGLCYRSAYKIIIQATDQKLWFSKHNRKKCILIPNPISENYYKSFKEEISHEVTEFIAAGRLDPVKNYSMMISAFAKVVKEYPQVQLSIFGTGADEYTQSLQDQINSLGMQNNISLMGRSAHIEDEYKKRDVFLMSSDYEGLPNALAEAMASRLICISTDCKTGPSDLIEEGVNGYMTSVGNSEALAKAIIKVINMSYEERVLMADAARHKILTYCSKDNSVRALSGILNE